MKNTLLVAFLTMFSVSSFAQGHFEVAFTGNGQDHMTITALQAIYNGAAMEAGDEIAVFDGSICCGKAILAKPIDSGNFISIAASKADVGQSNGYTEGHAITYKFWDSSKSEEFSRIKADYFDKTALQIAAPNFTANGSTFVKLSGQDNRAPAANAGADQSVNEGATVTLDGSASTDPDLDALTYLWTAPAGITLSSTTAAKPTFTAPEVTTDTEYTFSLVVNDGTVDSPADQVVITVKQVNKAPTASAGADQTVDEGATVTLDGSASSDADANALTYLWTAPAGITLSSTTAAKPTFTAPQVTTDTQYTFSLVVNDGTVDSPADQVVITVKQVNKAPAANAGADQTVDEGASVTLDGSAFSDADANAQTYLWTAPTGITLSSTTAAKPTFTAPQVTTDTQYTFSLVVNDGTVDSPADQVVITVKQVNKAPAANAGSDQTVDEGATVTLNGSASSDADANALTYLWTAPAGITLSSTTAAKPIFTAPEVSTDTQYTFSLVVNDGTVDSPADQVVVTVKQVNKAPAANAGSDQTVDEGATVTLDGSASSDADANTLTYLWTAPAGITLSSTTAAKPTFTAPEVTTDTPYTFSLVVNDGTVDSPSDQVVVTVKHVKGHFEVAFTGNGQDHMTITALQAIYNGAAMEAGDEIAVFDGSICCGKAILAKAIDSGNFISIAASKADVGQLNGYTEGHAITYKFWDSSKSEESSGIKADYFDKTALQITAPNFTANGSAFVKLSGQDNRAPAANAGSDQTVDEGATVTLDGSASSDADANTLTYLWTAPAGITLSSTTAAKPTFTAPQVTTDTQYTFSLVVNDGTLSSASDQVVVTVKFVTDLEQNSQNDDVHVYPNPIKDNLTIDLGTLTNCSIRIINILGQTVYSSQVHSQKMDINMSKIASSGLYYLHVIDKQKNVIVVKKLLKK